MSPKICLSIMPRTADEGKSLQDKAAKKDADLLEIRLDYLKQPANLAWISFQTDIPYIATNRPASQGGEFKGTEEERFQILLNAAHAGFDYIDIEDTTEALETKIKSIQRSGAKIIFSHHNMQSTPSLLELKHILNNNSRYNAEIYKIVTTARTINDSLIVLNFISETSQKFKIVCFAMGENGKISRLACPIFGSFFTIASLKKGSETAAGQLTIDELRTIYDKLNLD